MTDMSTLSSDSLKLVNAEMNQVMELMEFESLALMISISCRIFEVADIGSVPG